MSINRRCKATKGLRELLRGERNEKRQCSLVQRQSSGELSTNIYQMLQPLWSAKSELDQTRVHVIALQCLIGKEPSDYAVLSCRCLGRSQDQINSGSGRRGRLCGCDNGEISERVKIRVSQRTAR